MGMVLYYLKLHCDILKMYAINLKQPLGKQK